MIRRWVNDWVAVPILTFLRTWVLNVVVSQIPFAPFRYAYYRWVCGIRLAPNSSLWRGARFTGDLLHEISIGSNCVIAFDSFWVVGAPITIQNDVIFGHQVSLYTSDHDPEDPTLDRRNAPILIEDHVFVGSQAVILPGVTIGRGAMVAAAAVVTKDVPPFTIVAGNPARVIRERQLEDFNYSHSGTPPFA